MLSDFKDYSMANIEQWVFTNISKGTLSIPNIGIIGTNKSVNLLFFLSKENVSINKNIYNFIINGSATISKYFNGVLVDTINSSNIDSKFKDTALSVDCTTPVASGNVVSTLIEPPVSLVDQANIATNASVGSFFKVILNGSRTLSNPIGASDGQILRWQIIQGTGNNGLNLDTKFNLGSLTMTLSTSVGASDFLVALYTASNDKFNVLGFTSGY